MLQSLKRSHRWLHAFIEVQRNTLIRLSFLLQPRTALTSAQPHVRILEGLKTEDDTFRHISFTFAVIALSARIACAEGPLTKNKYIAFRESFPLNGGICGKIRQLFTLACNDKTPKEHYINQIKYMYPEKTDLFTSVIERLFRIASADGAISHTTEAMLSDIAHSLDLCSETFAQIHNNYEQASRAHIILGVSKETSSVLLKKRYHELMRRYHPDRYGTEELSDEIRLLLRAKTSEINNAYRTLSKRAA